MKAETPCVVVKEQGWAAHAGPPAGKRKKENPSRPAAALRNIELVSLLHVLA
jgi:hypothetical protein